MLLIRIRYKHNKPMKNPKKETVVAQSAHFSVILCDRYQVIKQIYTTLNR